MTTYDERNKLASRADSLFGTGEAQTLMDMLSTGERLEIEIVKLRAEMDQRFAQIDQRFAQIDQRFIDLQQAILDGVDEKLKAAARFDRGTIWAAVASIAASVLAAGVAIALAVAFG